MQPIVTTRSGKHVNLLEPAEDSIDVNDIAHALSNQARFNGHTHDFYSVAQHSVMVSRLVPTEHALTALLHDAAEAYVGDMVTPLKHMMPAFQEVEDGLFAVIARKFGIDRELPAAVVHADRVMLATEQRDMLVNFDDWGLPTPMRSKLRPWAQGVAKRMFLEKFWALYAGCEHVWVTFHSEGQKECHRCGAKSAV